MKPKKLYPTSIEIGQVWTVLADDERGLNTNFLVIEVGNGYIQGLRFPSRRDTNIRIREFKFETILFKKLVRCEAIYSEIEMENIISAVTMLEEIL